jgi:hypothetical protein
MTHTCILSAALARPVAVVALIPLLLGGCAVARPRLAAPDAGARREDIASRGERCRAGACTTSLAVGGRPFRVVSRARRVSPEEATGRPRGSLVGRAVAAAGGAVLREAGVATSGLVVGVGTRSVAGSAGTPDAECELVWVDEETREKVGGEERVALARLAEGLACTAATSAGGAAVRWRFGRGISPSRDSLALLLSGGALAAAAPSHRPATLERMAPSGTHVAERYVVALDTTGWAGAGELRARVARWEVRRADGTAVGAVLQIGAVFDPALPTAAVDIRDVATPDEAAILRLIGACLVPPLSAA